VLPEPDFNKERKRELREITGGCFNVLENPEQILDKYGELKSGSRSIGIRVKRLQKRLK
jgi:hypothetical protein